MTHLVLVTDKVAPSGLAPLMDDDDFEVRLENDSESDGFASALSSAEALIVRSATTVDEALMARAGALRVIGRAGVGVDNVDIAAASSRGIAVYNAPGGNTIAATELTIGLMLAAARNIAAGDASLRAGNWDRAAFKGVELRSKTLGLVGAGRIGGEVATRCQAFGMDVLIFDPYLTASRAEELGARLIELDEVLEKSDFISVHVPLTEETKGLIGEDALQQMKPSAYLVNASRGGVVDEAALAKALERGDLAGAALDVFEHEPLADDSPLRSAPNLVLTPHLGASTVEAQEGVATEVAAKVRDALVAGDFSEALNADRL